MEYEVLGDEIMFSWPHPFTWKDYPITGYQIVCREMESEKIIHDMTINDTEEPVVNHTVTLPPDIPDCYALQCNVTAFNFLDGSVPSISNFLFPYCKCQVNHVQIFGKHVVLPPVQASLSPRVVAVKQTTLQESENGIFICVEVSDSL